MQGGGGSIEDAYYKLFSKFVNHTRKKRARGYNSRTFNTIAQSSSDPQAQIEKAYDLYADAIFRHCYFRLFSRELGKEMMQETFMKVFEYVKSGHEIDNIRAFLYRTANNLIIDYVRKKHEESLDALQEAGFDPTGSSGDELAEALDEKHILAVLQKLGKESRELIVMRHIDNLKPQEIAEILGIEANTASVRIHRAMQELKVLLTQKP